VPFVGTLETDVENPGKAPPSNLEALDLAPASDDRIEVIVDKGITPATC
jgi:hypothetical protein